MIKVNTIEQFKVLQFIKQNFYSDNIDISIVDEVSLQVKDSSGDSIVFKWDGEAVVENI